MSPTQSLIRSLVPKLKKLCKVIWIEAILVKKLKPGGKIVWKLVSRPPQKNSSEFKIAKMPMKSLQSRMLSVQRKNQILITWNVMASLKMKP